MPDPDPLPYVLEPTGAEVRTAAGGARRYRKPLQCFRWPDIQYLLTESFSSWSQHKAPRLGASLAFYTLLSFAPLLPVVVAVVGLVFGHTAAQHEIVRQVQMLVGTAGAKTADALLQASHHRAQGALATLSLPLPSAEDLAGCWRWVCGARFAAAAPASLPSS